MDEITITLRFKRDAVQDIAKLIVFLEENNMAPGIRDRVLRALAAKGIDVVLPGGSKGL